MLPPVLIKYAFRIRTRVGLVVENLMIHGRDAADAERKLRQIYRDCTILDCNCYHGTYGSVRASAATFEEVVDLIAG